MQYIYIYTYTRIMVLPSLLSECVIRNEEESNYKRNVESVDKNNASIFARYFLLLLLDFFVYFVFRSVRYLVWIINRRIASIVASLDIAKWRSNTALDVWRKNARTRVERSRPILHNCPIRLGGTMSLIAGDWYIILNVTRIPKSPLRTIPLYFAFTEEE